MQKRLACSLRIFQIEKKDNMLLSALTFKQALWGKWKSCSSMAGMNIVLFLMLITQTSGKAALLTFELEGDGVTGVTSEHISECPCTLGPFLSPAVLLRQTWQAAFCQAETLLAPRGMHICCVKSQKLRTWLGVICFITT